MILVLMSCCAFLSTDAWVLGSGVKGSLPPPVLPSASNHPHPPIDAHDQFRSASWCTSLSARALRTTIRRAGGPAGTASPAGAWCFIGLRTCRGRLRCRARTRGASPSRRCTRWCATARYVCVSAVFKTESEMPLLMPLCNTRILMSYFEGVVPFNRSLQVRTCNPRYPC